MSVGSLFGAGANYYLVDEMRDRLQGLGEDARAGATDIANQAVRDTRFQPYTVSSNLANVGTTAQGGLAVNLTPQQRAMQNAAFGQANQFFGQAGQGMTPAEQRAALSLFNQAQGQFGQVGEGMTRAERDAQNRRFREAESMFGRARGDTGALASEYYENIRAAQRPEEERQRMNLDQGLFSSGRGGISTAEFGGTAEEFAFEKARAEAGLQASAAARQAALGEQAQALKSAQALSGQAYLGEQASQARDAQALALGTGLMSQSFSPEQQALAQQTGYGNLGALMMGQGYVPQQQAISLFGASQIPAQLASAGQLGGAELRAQLEAAGLEGMLSAGVSETQIMGDFYEQLVASVGSGIDSIIDLI